MRITKFIKNKIVLILISLITTHSFAADDVAKTGKVFTDSGTFEVSLVRIGPEKDNTFLALISGSDSEFDGKVLKLKQSGGGTSATYYTKEDGGNVIRAPQHEYFGWEAYVGGKTFKISLNREESKKMKTEELLKLYQEQNKNKK